VTDSWLTHGHVDHYGTTVEQARMMENAGKPITFWGSKEDVVGITGDQQGNMWNIAGALPASETGVRGRTTKYYEFDKWYDFGNVQIMVIWSPGHTPGTTNMLFKVKNPVDGKFYTFGYHGGYGFNGLERPTASNGWLRLVWQHGFSFLQQTVDVRLRVAAAHESVSDRRGVPGVEGIQPRPRKCEQAAHDDGCDAVEGVRLAGDQWRQHDIRIRQPVGEAAFGRLI
jgi:hypothetical protein